MPATLSVPKVSNSSGNIRRVLFIATFILILTGSLKCASLLYLPAGQIAPGVRIATVDLSGQSQESARSAVEKLALDCENRTITIRYALPNSREYVWKYRPNELGLSVDVNATVSQAMVAGRDDPIGRVTQIVGGAHDTHSVTPLPLVDRSVLDKELKKIAHTINRPPSNCRLSVSEDGQLKVESGKPGVSINLESSADAVTRLWAQELASQETQHLSDTIGPDSGKPSGKPDAANTDSTGAQPAQKARGEGIVDLILNTIPPPIAETDVAKIDGPIGEMNTRIRGTLQRVHNVTIATSHINGTLLGPGDTFSYNRVVGKRSEEGGYEKAIVFVKGRHVEDIGGGICQTASTLYNAVLRSGLKVVRRQPHCTPVVYVPYGLDATVAYGVVDFQFRNDTDYPVYIYAKAKGRSLTFRIYGKTDTHRKVVLERLRESSTPTSTELVLDRSLRPGRRIVKDKGARGYTIVWRRTITENGETVRSETINSHYRPIPAIVAVGPAGTARSAPNSLPKVPASIPVQAPGAIHSAGSNPAAQGGAEL